MKSLRAPLATLSEWLPDIGRLSTAFYLWIYFSSFPLSRQRRQGPMQNFAFPMQSLHEGKLKESFCKKE
ncbi:hypothetical protein F9L00_02445 [Brucella anthropi]|uniref:Uncharacterized protein n=1 Tax=Brucella lupini TaxID=255457 RepID=A0AB34DVK9_9HYPH|nr:hypothetical protein F9L03_01605 [Brucella lupini]KAB2725715.1 hypothetical protein F9K76_13115 [Brucella anthropi]KAB2741765.1 hypothetical protein F9K90_01460 [Brucella anthropi]KAB2743025.1 hypothetical protein F9K74_13060 [Brucella anthropi]KAB2748226.1 hypothetical protein F9L05_16555 [Brucella anthropi]